MSLPDHEENRQEGRTVAVGHESKLVRILKVLLEAVRADPSLPERSLYRVRIGYSAG